ncbi:MAG: iron-containing alcohol dehydrogenase [Planctomycetota bacterium]
MPLQCELARLPALHIGQGTLARLPGLLAPAERILLVRGGASLDDTAEVQTVLQRLRDDGRELHEQRVQREPSVEDIQEACATWRGAGIDAVLAIGGGSALDTGKALAGLLHSGTDLLDHLEGVGRGHPWPGGRLRLVMVPTTAGTGSETTMNAVIGGELDGQAFKKSLRHPDLMADHAIVDPVCSRACPPARSAACGMDACTQLLESLLSTQASPLTDGIARAGLAALAPALAQSVTDGSDLEARAGVAFGACCSGIALAHAGLGPVHGFAPWMGAWYGIDHGVACGALLAASLAVTLEALRERAPAHPARDRIAWFGRLVTADDRLGRDAAEDAAVAFLDELTETCGLPRLGVLGLDAAACRRLSGADKLVRNNPVALDRDELLAILQRRL